MVPGKERDRVVDYMGKRYMLRYVVGMDGDSQMTGESADLEDRAGTGRRSGVETPVIDGVGARSVVIDYA